jgi:hypothetical protein
MLSTDLKIRYPVVVTNTTANGGRKGQRLVTEDGVEAEFPLVTQEEATAGGYRWRKFFYCNDHATDLLNSIIMWLGAPSVGDDRFYLGAGTQTDTQATVDATPPILTGVGQLSTLLSGGESQIDIQMPNDDYEFINGGHIVISNRFMTGQTIDSAVVPGDSVTFASSKWSKKGSAITDITYPDGKYIGGNIVWTNNSDNLERIALPDNLTTDEDIGDGNGVNASPTLTNLANVTNGLVTHPTMTLVVTSTSGGSPYTATMAADGSFTGDCSAGQITVSTGVWTTPITWNNVPDNSTDITATYRDKCYTYVGNLATVDLDATVANAYATADTFCAGAIESSSAVVPALDTWVLTSGATGTYDDTTYPVLLYNTGTEEDSITITFNSATTFTVSAVNAGTLATGAIGSDYEPINPDTSIAFFKIRAAGWGGTFQSGDTVTFNTHPAAFPYWKKQVWDAGASAADSSSQLGVIAQG